MKSNKTRIIIYTIFLILFTYQVFSQKLPNIQQKSIKAPENIKIDGKDLEWSNQFNTYNKATEVFYNLTNDKDFVYLVVKVINPSVIKKIIFQGITFSLYTDNNKEDVKGLSILFPKYDSRNQTLYMSVNNTDSKYKDKSDSLLNVYNGRIVSKLKQLEITDFKDNTKETLSIYNEEQIKAYGLLNINFHFIYELAIPIKYLSNKTSFYYNLKINGAGGGNEIIAIETANGTVLSYKGADGVSYNLGYLTPENLALSSSTDFTGFYKMISK